ncbi:MAG: hypothetical protein A3F18_06265 [Legionellales bacterium RIFCSPHIGHO2_12_FULL_37_14]|nr:MAG: hypothetical protein A3F18_06265 [Legionellales bacterium RIFCSPHIGHO2_12_FULL_37_14]
MAWTGVDYIIVGVIGLSTLTGMLRGFFKELISLMAWILAICLAIKYTAAIAYHLSGFIADNTLRNVISFIGIIVVTLFLGMFVNVVLGLLLQHSGLRVSDRVIGLGFGFARGVVIVALIILIVGMSGFNLQPYQNQSTLFNYFNPIVLWMTKYVQPFIADTIEDGQSKLPAYGNKNTSSSNSQSIIKKMNP